ncbi:Alpha/beta hydrolase family protein [Nonomuraea pusilla]|uniref:Alpha/beta hydrolase family protein n=2 Tax=Nonomuraea pusilla TaxID=46177 RepID=A0A1H7ZQR9_9ACTN|nr:Alpha/beta hydrolase family protein [Nonomuraea pusilla]
MSPTTRKTILRNPMTKTLTKTPTNTKAVTKSVALVLTALAAAVHLTPPASALASGPGTPDSAVEAPLRPALPAPTGKALVGTARLHLVDPARRDPWNRDAARRELMVSLWYPAAKATGRRAPYVTPQESAAILASAPGGKDLPPGTLTGTRTHAWLDAPVRSPRGGLPLVLMSPGFSFPRATLTSLAEDLASRGYLVAAVEHTYESVATTFPDGRTTSCLACVRGQDGAKVAESRVADVRFVLDELTRGRWGAAVDGDRIAMAGHSMGGNTALHAMRADSRIKAGVNLDGTIIPLPSGPLARPFMLVGAPETHAPGGTDASWRTSWPGLTGPRRWITVAGADHAAFVDHAVLRPQLGLPAQELDGERALRVTRAHLAAFLDRHLRGGRTPEPAFPEVETHG